MWPRDSNQIQRMTNTHRGLIYVSLCTLVLQLSMQAGVAQFNRFVQYDSQDGLFSSTIERIKQDRSGFLWVRTRDALLWHDGYTFTMPPVLQKLPRSMQHVRIIDFLEDKRGNYWFMTEGPGLMRYDPATGRLRVFFSPPLTKSSLEKFEFATISIVRSQLWLSDSFGNVWFALKKGLLRYSYLTGKFSLFSADASTPGFPGNERIRCLYADSHGDVWIGTQAGLWRYNQRVARFEAFLSQSRPVVNTMMQTSDQRLWVGTDDQGLFVSKTGGTDNHEIVDFAPVVLTSSGSRLAQLRRRILTLTEDSQKRLWAGTALGVQAIETSPDGHYSVSFFLDEPQFLDGFNSNTINRITTDYKGNIWAIASSRANGFFFMPVNGKRFSRVKGSSALTYYFGQYGISDLLIDKSDVMWIGFNKGGLIKIDLRQKPFYSLQHQPGDSVHSINSNEVFAIYLDPDSNLWSGTNRGLNRFNLKTGINTVYTKNPGVNAANTLGGHIVGQIVPDPQGFLWLGYFDNKVSKFYPSTQTVKTYTQKAWLPHTFLPWSVRKILPDTGNTVWIAPTTHGLIRYEKNTDRFFYYDTLNSEIPDNFLFDLCHEGDSVLWIATQSKGVCRFSKKTGKFTTYSHYPDDPTSISSNETRCLLNDDVNNLLWVGTLRSGICCLDKRTGRFTRYSTENGLRNNSIIAIAKDQHNRLWISTLSGIVRFDPALRQFRTYDQGDGLAGNEFSVGALYQSADGFLFFGGNQGIVWFHPDSIHDNHSPACPALTGLRIFGKPIYPGDSINRRVLLTSDLRHTTHIVLNHNENDITVEFTGLNFASPENNRYAYMLDGYDKEWKIADAASRQAIYTNLSPGKYLFRLWVSNSDGVWNPRPVVLRITILQAWHQRWWVRMLAVLMLSLLVFFVVRLRTYRINQQRIALAREVALRTADLEEKNRQINEYAQRLHEADQTKLRFFINVSHEFRTPLSLILAPLAKIIDEKKDIVYRNSKDAFMLMYRNGRRLLELIGQILDMRKIELHALRLSPTPTQMNEFVAGIVELFSGWASAKCINLVYEAHIQQVSIVIDREKIEKVLFNILSNAFKFTPKGGTITIHLSSTSDSLALTVSDTGPGIPEDRLTRIFDRFYSDNTLADQPAGGTGIGLAYALELIRLHKGDIRVVSRSGSGSAFTVVIPFDTGLSVSSQSEINTLADFDFTRSMLDGVSMTGTTNIGFDIDSLQGGNLPLVLIADDNPEMTDYLVSELRNKFQIIKAGNGIEAEELAVRHQPDLIVSDVMMPQKSGIELCQALKCHPETNHIPIILLSAKAGENDQIDGLRSGADDYVPKPFSMALLLAKINSLLANRKQLADIFRQADGFTFVENYQGSDKAFLQRALEIIDQNIGNSNFDINTLVQQMGISRTPLYAKIKALTGESPGDFIRNMRIRKAMTLLRASDMAVAEIAFRTGFSDPSYFSKCFKAQTGKTPGEYAASDK